MIKNIKKIKKNLNKYIQNVIYENFTKDMKNGVVIEIEKNKKKIKIKMNLNTMLYG